LNRSQSCPRIYDKRINEKGNNIRLKMADVMMAESSSASLSRRQHLANTFEAYRAGLDADVSSPVFPVIESWQQEREKRKIDHYLPINHPTIQKTYLPLPPRSHFESSCESKDIVTREREREGDLCQFCKDQGGVEGGSRWNTGFLEMESAGVSLAFIAIQFQANMQVRWVGRVHWGIIFLALSWAWDFDKLEGSSGYLEWERDWGECKSRKLTSFLRLTM
jgi:hypothetical protein